MKTNSLTNGLRNSWSPYKLLIKSLILSAFILTVIQTTLHAQDPRFTKPSWWFGAAIGANYNIYQGSTQQLNSNFTSLATFHNGAGVGLYLAPLIEYHSPDSRWGIMLQTGYDSRRGSFKSIASPCNCPLDLYTNLSYFTIEPSLRIQPFKSNFYLFGGPRFAINLTKEFTYEQGINPTYPLQEVTPDVTGDLSYVNKSRISMQIGAGYDIPVSSQNKHTQFVISPFISFQPYFGQSPRSIETWSVTTIRAGVAIKFGKGHKRPAPVVVEQIAPIVVFVEPEVKFTVYSPKNIPAERTVRETFPLLNYVFFNIGSTQIPDRYVLLRKGQVKDFKEEQLETKAPLEMTGRSSREMIVYYNVLNILGDRLGKYPSTTITLVGSSESGPKDGKEIAESTKQYLVDIFGIDPVRISIEGRVKPKIPSEQPGGTLELVLLREGDRRVSIESGSPELLMEFQSGPEATLRPVEIVTLQEAPVDSYVSFYAERSNEAFSSWKLEIMDENGAVQYFGPYTKEKVSIPGKSILGTRAEGDFKVTMIGETKSGKTVKKETPVHIVLWALPITEEGMRYSVVFDFNKSNAIAVYDKYLTEIVTPKIPQGGTVIIHGYTDIIGNEAHNLELSLARANEVKSIIEKALAKAGRNDVKFEVYGFGEDENLAQFGNKYPEERFYNRTVIIDIIPHASVL